MALVLEESVKNNRDSILIYEIGKNNQENHNDSSSGVSPYRLNKSISCVLQHWELLRNNYADLNEWGILHTPYRYGQIVYSDQDLLCDEICNAFDKAFIDDIITKSPLLCGLHVEPCYNGDNEITKFKFPRIDSFYYTECKNGSGLTNFDLQILSDLGFYYSKLETSYLAVISTCPNIVQLEQAIHAEILAWLYDINEIINYSIPENNQSRISGIEKINRHLNSAFECGREIVNKISWFDNLSSTKQKIKIRLIELEFPETFANILLEKLRPENCQHKLSQYKDMSKVLTGYVGLISTIQNSFSSYIHLTREKEALAEKYLSNFTKVINNDRLIEDIFHKISIGRKKHFELIDVVKYFYDNQVKNYLEMNDYPAKYHRDLLFPAKEN